MGLATIRQPSFAAGELSPTLWGRTDIKAYASGLRRSRNGYITLHGAWVNRPGFRYCGEVKDSTKRVRLAEFNFSDEQQYVLELGNQYIRFWVDGGRVESSPGVAYELATPYLEADLAELVWAQSGDVITFAHPAYDPYELKRLAATSWTLAAIAFSPDPLLSPAPLEPILYPGWTFGAVDSYHPKKEWQWVVCAVFGDGTVSFPSRAFSESGGSLCYNDRPMKVRWYSAAAVACMVFRGRAGTWGFVGLGEQADTGGAGYWQFTDDGKEPDFTIQPTNGQHPFRSPDWAGNTHYFSGDQVQYGGEIYECIQAGFSNPATPPTGHGSTIRDGWPLWQSAHVYAQWDLVTTSQRILMAAQVAGTSAGTEPVWDPPSMYGTKVDNTVTWDLLNVDTAGRYPYVGGISGQVVWRWVKTGTLAARRPRAITHYQQRRVFAGTDDKPDTIFLSALGDYYDFDKHQLLNDTSPLVITLATARLEKVRWLAPHNNLITGTSSSEWTVGGSRGAPLGPASQDARSHSQRGSGDVRPMRVGNIVLYVQKKGTVVRDIIPGDQLDTYSGSDRSILVRHLFSGFTVVDWCYAEDPNSMVWAVRSDGKLLTLTYEHDQQLWAWGWHESDGLFESVTSVVEGDEDVVYAVVNRTIGGVAKRYIERLATRTIGALEDCIFLDASVTYDGTPATVLSGLSHLEGKEVKALADGNVVGPFTVASGQITLEEPASKVQAGLSYVSELESLDCATGEQGQEARTRVKVVRQVGIEVEASRGLKVAESVDADAAFWSEWKQRVGEDAFGPIPLYSGLVKIAVSGRFGYGGRAAVRQEDPLPVTVIGLAREVELGGE